MPIANHSKHQQKKRNQQQTGSFRGKDRVPIVLVAGIVVVLGMNHTYIVRRAETARDGATLRCVVAHG
jgi:hypothetical protein